MEKSLPSIADLIGQAVLASIDQRDPTAFRWVAEAVQFLHEVISDGGCTGMQMIDEHLLRSRTEQDLTPRRTHHGNAKKVVDPTQLIVKMADRGLKPQRNMGSVVRAVVGDVGLGVVAAALLLHPRERITSDQPPHAGSDHHQFLIALAKLQFSVDPLDDLDGSQCIGLYPLPAVLKINIDQIVAKPFECIHGIFEPLHLLQYPIAIGIVDLTAGECIVGNVAIWPDGRFKSLDQENGLSQFLLRVSVTNTQ